MRIAVTQVSPAHANILARAIPPGTEMHYFPGFPNAVPVDLFRPNNLIIIGVHRMADLLRIVEVQGDNLVVSSVAAPRIANQVVIPTRVFAHQVRPLGIIKTPSLVTGVHRPETDVLYLTGDGKLLRWNSSKWVIPPRLRWRVSPDTGLSPHRGVSLARYPGSDSLGIILAPPVLKAIAITPEEITALTGLTVGG